MAKVAAKPVMRAALNATLATSPRRILIAPVEDMAVHLEAGHLSAGTDWAALARHIETDAGRSPHDGGA